MYFTFFFTLFASLLQAYQYELSICAIFQNEAPYLKEWIDYHRLVGAEHFYLYNNDSTDEYLKVLTPYINEQIVELFNWPSHENSDFFYGVQSPAYTNAIHRTKKVSHWLAIIDVDEFIVPVQEKTVTECLNKRFSLVSGVCVNWQNYGTSHITHLDSSRPMIEQLVWKMKWDHPQNNIVKSIVQPEHVQDCPNPHYCTYLPEHGHLDTHCEKIHKQHYTLTPHLDVLRINHYWSRDENYFFNQKIPRYTKWNGHLDGIIELEKLMNEEYDPILIGKIVPK